ncbi:MAG: prepilin-type N-terminal cleavage/methylation domain-containing protein [Rickettsiales bacterium]
MRQHPHLPPTSPRAAGFTLVEPKQSEVPAKAGIHPLQAFTLVELSIVLVIIGLLVGGILGGQSLIRGAELKTVLTDFSKYKSATIQFKSQYNGLPGDLIDAQDYWGVANATPATCVGTSSAGVTATCNGNGDGAIFPSAGSNESYRYWQHLASAGLIQGSYNGVSTGLDAGAASDKNNSPVGKMSNSMWFVWNWGNTNQGYGAAFNVQYDNWLQFGAAGVNIWPAEAILTPEETYAIDKKIDDGKPGTGNVLGMQISGCTLAANVTDTSAEYRLTNKSIACSISFPRFTAQ